VFIANIYMQDLFALGYTSLLSYHYNRDDADTHYDDNGFLMRPAPIGFVAGARPGDIRAKDLDVHYLGWGGEGHLGRLNISHQYYFAFGRDERNEIANRRQTIEAHMAALEASVDVDWLRLKAQVMYASGDRNPQNATAAGFDGIFDNPFFAGAGFSYFNRQNIPFLQTGVQLVNRFSLYPDLSSSKFEGHSNFVNPGLFLAGVGLSGRLTPKLFFDLNVNYLQFAQPEVLEYLLVQDNIGREIGIDYSLGLQYRPILTNNIICTLGMAALTPGHAFRRLYQSETLYSSFLALTFTY
jgi:hypothetical protein